MTPNRSMMLKVLINRYNPKNKDKLLQFLPKDEAQEISNQTIHSADLGPILTQPYKVLDRIHPSWIAPIVQQFPKELHPVLIAATHPKQSEGLKQLLGVETPLPQSAPVKTFLLLQLYQSLKIENLLPEEYLPETDLSPLIHIERKTLLEVMNLLGLHDLAADMRQIVNKNYLKNLYSCLNNTEMGYLKICLHQRDKLVSPKLAIDPAVKDCDKLKRLIHQRGLIRLAKACAGRHEDWIWYLSRTLDAGRGKLLLQYYQKEPIPEVTALLRNQVITVINYLNKSNL